MDDVALIDLAQTGPARQRRNDLGIAEHRLRVVDRRLVGFHQRFLLGDDGALRIVLLPGAGISGGKLLVACQVEALIGELGFVLRLLGDGLIVLRLVEHWIDLSENIAFLDILSLDEIHGDQFAVNLGAHQHVVQGANRTDAVEINRHVLDAWCRRQHGYRKIGTRVPVGGLPLLQRGPGDVAEAAEDQERNRDRNGSAARTQGHAGNTVAGGFRGFVQIRLKEH
jgi:hypothetical protein